MKKSSIVISLFLIMGVLVSSATLHGWNLDDLKKKGEKVYNEAIGNKKPLTNKEVIRGLKEALTVGIKKSTKLASKVNGYYKNPRIFIPFPPKAKKVKETAEKLGMDKQVKKFVKTLNRAAEEAAKEAVPIFVHAIKQLTIKDGFEILNGSNNAATKYLQRKTSARLKGKFKPVVKRAINKVKVTKYWNPLATKYNALPMNKKVNPDLDDYVTDKAIKGLFVLIANEELKIRKDPVARITELLKRVFGYKK